MTFPSPSDRLAYDLDAAYLADLQRSLEQLGTATAVKAIGLIRIVDALAYAVGQDGSLPGSLCNEIVKWRRGREMQTGGVR